MKVDILQVARIMNRCIADLYEEGEISESHIERRRFDLINDDEGDALTFDTLAFYPFAPEDVQAVHTHKWGVGDGIWFRLKDGRVIDKAGQATDQDPDLYDRVPN